MRALRNKKIVDKIYVGNVTVKHKNGDNDTEKKCFICKDFTNQICFEIDNEPLWYLNTVFNKDELVLWVIDGFAVTPKDFWQTVYKHANKNYGFTLS